MLTCSRRDPFHRRLLQEKRTLSGSVSNRINAVLIDFGGVLAEEGFKEGLMAIGRQAGLSPEAFFETAAAAVYESGYVLGQANENAFWNVVRARTGVKNPDEELRREILNRFTIRPWMLEIVRTLRQRGCCVCILSDQTQWLDELDRQYPFFKEFHRVFNSYHSGKGKKDPSLFLDVARELGIQPSQILFIDDNPGNVERARSQGFRAIHYKDRESLEHEMKKLGLL